MVLEVALEEPYQGLNHGPLCDLISRARERKREPHAPISSPAAIAKDTNPHM